MPSEPPEVDERDGLSTARAGQAKSGKWHLVGEHGCLNAGQAAFSSRARAVSSDKRNREWCSYCLERLRMLELREEVRRLRAERRASDRLSKLPDHLTLRELIQIAAEADTIVDVQQSARLQREEARRFLSAFGLRQLVDDGPTGEPTPSIPDGANHSVAASISAPRGSGWGQRSDQSE